MHILFLTDNFPPEVNAPASRTFEHCREWVKKGHGVTVITCAPNFPHGRVYEGYRNRPWQKEVMDGVKVIRVWSYMTSNAGFIKRILDYISFMFSSVCAIPFISEADVIVGTSPQFFTACAAYIGSRIKRIPFIFELRDLWPESIKAVGAMKNRPLIRLLERVEIFLYKKASAVVAVTESFKKILIARGIAADKIYVITNGVNFNGFRRRPKDERLSAQLGLAGKFVAGYVGTHGLAHGLEVILECADLMRRIDQSDSHRFILLGDGAKKEELKSKALKMGLHNVIFLESVPKSEVPRYWALLDASIIHLKKEDLFTSVIPSKLFECMGMGIPVLNGVKGESAAIVQKEDIGLVFEPEDAWDLCKKLMRLRRDTADYHRMQVNCMAAARHYDRSALAIRMLDVLKAATSGKI